MAGPAAPDSETRERLLAVLAELVGRGGAGPLLLPPVAPGDAAFPEPWAPTRDGVALLLRRLLWHAGIERDVVLDDRRAGAPPTERKPATRLELLEVRRTAAAFALGFIGDDDVVGTFAHEIGVVHAVLHRPDEADPYRTAAEAPVIAVDPEVDLVRGSIATVYLGLGVLAANAARQQHSILEGQGFNPLLVAKVGVQVEAGHLPVASLAFLVAVQAVVRGDTAPPPGLESGQRADVARWISTLRDGSSELRARLGIASDATAGSRAPAIVFADAKLEPDATPEQTAFRWRTHRGGVGLIAGTVIGVGIAAIVASRGLALGAAFGAATGGHLIGRRVRVPRCSACATVVGPSAPTCPRCGAVLRGDIAQLSDRLEAEEGLAGDDHDVRRPG